MNFKKFAGGLLFATAAFTLVACSSTAQEGKMILVRRRLPGGPSVFSPRKRLKMVWAPMKNQSLKPLKNKIQM